MRRYCASSGCSAGSSASTSRARPRLGRRAAPRAVDEPDRHVAARLLQLAREEVADRGEVRHGSPATRPSRSAHRRTGRHVVLRLQRGDALDREQADARVVRRRDFLVGVLRLATSHCMFDWPEPIHTSPTRTSVKRVRRGGAGDDELVGPARRLRRERDPPAAAGDPRSSRRAARAAAPRSRSFGAAQPQTPSGICCCSTMWSEKIAGSRGSAAAGDAVRSSGREDQPGSLHGRDFTGFAAALSRAGGSRLPQRGAGLARALSMAAVNASSGWAPTSGVPLMKKVGVPSTPTLRPSAWSRSSAALRRGPSRSAVNFADVEAERRARGASERLAVHGPLVGEDAVVHLPELALLAARRRRRGAPAARRCGPHRASA